MNARIAHFRTGFLTGLVAAFFLCLSSFGVLAQSGAETPDYEAWTAIADRAEDALEGDRASNLALESLRSQIADWREVFLVARNANEDRINTLKSQISALGTVPEGTEEPAEIAGRRTELNDRLNKLRAPGLAAQEAFTRADGLIGEIDRTISTRQTDRLLTLGPSPLNPVNWPAALDVVRDVFRTMGNELKTATNSAVSRAELQGNLPIIILFLLLAAVLLWKGRYWVTSAGAFLRERTRRGTGVWSFLISVGLILLPLLGLFLIFVAVDMTGMVGLRTGALLGLLPDLGALILVAGWICNRVFADQGEESLLPLKPRARREARWNGVGLAVVVAVGNLLNALTDLSTAGNSAAASAVLQFPVFVLAGILLFRLGQVLLKGGNPRTDEDEEPSFRARMLRLSARLIMIVAIGGPVLAAVGYTDAATAVMAPTIYSLGLLGLLLILQRFIGDLYRFITRTDDAETEGLIPVLIGFLLSIGFIPLFALAWGVRDAQLTEIWTTFREGFSIGDSRISPTDFITFVLVFLAGYGLTRLLQGALRSSVLPKTNIDVGGRNAIVSGTGYVGIFLAALVAISSVGLDLSSLAIVAGALSVGIGFGLQNIVSNFVSGIILLIERPISEGDWIEVGGQMGYVRNISVRSTRIETFDRTDVIVPNADLVSGVVTNWTRGNTVGRVIVPVGVAYGTDTKQVEAVLREIANAHPMVLGTPPPNVIFHGFGADSMDFEIRAILRDVNWMMNVKSDMNHQIAAKFKELNIEIPFAQRDVWLRNPEVLRPTQDQPTPNDEDKDAAI